MQRMQDQFSRGTCCRPIVLPGLQPREAFLILTPHSLDSVLDCFDKPTFLKLSFHHAKGTHLDVNLKSPQPENRLSRLHHVQKRPGRMAQRAAGGIYQPDFALHLQFLHPHLAKRLLLEIFLDAHTR